jgi:hypothetical protein
VDSTKKRRSLAEAFGNGPAREVREQPDKPTTNDTLEMVPGKGGNPVLADSPVNMTFTVTAKERYLWTLELKRRGVSAVSVLRKAMDELLEGEGA